MHRTTPRRALTRSPRTCTILLVATLALTACERGSLYKQQFLQFGTLIEVGLVAAPDTNTEQIFIRIEQLLKTRHRQWHGWQDGDLKRFNDALVSDPGGRVAIPTSLQQLIGVSQTYHRITEGRFNPALGKLVDAWGFHASSEPNHSLIEIIKRDIPGMDDLVISGGRASTRNPHLQLDFGGIAKGLAIHQMAELLTRHGVDSFIINAGGDVYARGDKRGHPWRVAIENPFASGIIGSLDLRSSRSIFTSGDYRRFFIGNAGARRHHIIDPLTGEPSQHIRSATVLHDDPVIADIAATTLMLTPQPQLETMAHKLNISEFLVITGDHNIHISDALNTRIDWRLPAQFEVQVYR